METKPDIFNFIESKLDGAKLAEKWVKPFNGEVLHFTVWYTEHDITGDRYVVGFINHHAVINLISAGGDYLCNAVATISSAMNDVYDRMVWAHETRAPALFGYICSLDDPNAEMGIAVKPSFNRLTVVNRLRRKIDLHGQNLTDLLLHSEVVVSSFWEVEISGARDTEAMIDAAIYDVIPENLQTSIKSVQASIR